MGALQERQPFEADAKEILRRGQCGVIKCLITANAATDIFHLYSRAHNNIETAKKSVTLFINKIRRSFRNTRGFS